MPSYKTPRLVSARDQASREVRANQWGAKNADHAIIRRLRKIVPFDQYAVSGLDYPGLGVGAGVMLASDMPSDFLKTFVERGLYSYDPLAYGLNATHNWGSWHDLDADALAGPKIAEILALQKTYGIATRSVVAFFRHDFRYGGATFTRDTPFSEDEKFILECATRTLHSLLSEAYIANMTALAGLTTGEIACLKAIAHGAGSEDAAKVTGFTVQTVQAYIKTAVQKLGTANRTHAAVEAVRRKIID